MVCPCFCRWARDKSQEVRTEGVSSEMLYSSGTPIRRGLDIRRVERGEVWSWERMREREDLERLVGSRGSWWLRIAVGYVC
jgi:hypothetical protein